MSKRITVTDSEIQIMIIAFKELIDRSLLINCGRVGQEALLQIIKKITKE